MKYLVKFSIDKLEVTYLAEPSVREKLSQIKVGETSKFGELMLCREESHCYEYEFGIFADDFDTATEKTYCRLYGHLKFGSYNKNRQNIYILYENQILYDEYALGARFYIEEALGLRFYRMSKLDICADFNYNAVRRLIQLYKDDDFDLYVNRKKINGSEKVKNQLVQAGDNPRKRLFAKPSLSLRNDDHSLEFMAYNKGSEITCSEKQYILDASGFNRLYRLEARCRTYKRLRVSLSDIGIADDELYARLQHESTLYTLFRHLLERVFYLRKKRKKINLVFELLKPQIKKVLPIKNMQAEPVC